MRISQLNAGDNVNIICDGQYDKNIFLGFTDRSEKYSETPKFKNLKELKNAGLGKTIAEIEELDRKEIYGHHVYAIFQAIKEDGSPDFKWGAYVYKGSFVLGSSAKRFSIELR